MSTSIPTANVAMLNAFQRIVSDLKSSINLESGLKSLVMMRFNLAMATDTSLKNLLQNISTNDDDILDRLKKIVIGKVECMEYVDDAKKENALKAKKRPATDVSEPVAKRTRLPVAPTQEKPTAPPAKIIDDDFFCRKRTAPTNFAPKPKAPLMPIQPITAVATVRPQSTSNSLDLMKKCKEIRLAKLEKQKIVNQETVQDTKSRMESFREQRIKEQQGRNNGIIPKIDKKNRRFH